MSTLQERLRREAEFMLDRGIVTRGQRLVSAGEMREAADALDAAEAEILRLTAYAVNVGCDNEGLRQERDAAEAKLTAIDALHYPIVEAEQPTRWCHHDGFSWPCATHRILHPDPEEGTDD